MPSKEKDRWTPFPHSNNHAAKADNIPITEQTQSPSYRIAYMDNNFLTLSELRSIRLGLELMKPEFYTH